MYVSIPLSMLKINRDIILPLCGVSILEDAQHSNGDRTEQPALANPALSREVGVPSQSQPLCDYVIIHLSSCCLFKEISTIEKNV